MAYNEAMTARLREAIAGALKNDNRKVVEKKMFRGITFMVDGKMMASAGDSRFMFRIDPELHDTVVEQDGVRGVIMGGRNYKGYVHVEESAVPAKRELEKWVALALDFNRKAKVSAIKRKA